MQTLGTNYTSSPESDPDLNQGQVKNIVESYKSVVISNTRRITKAADATLAQVGNLLSLMAKEANHPRLEFSDTNPGYIV